MKIIIPVSLKQWERQNWNFSPLTPLVANMDLSMGTLIHKFPLSQQWKQTGMIHITPIWSCGMNSFTWEGGELELGLLQSQVGITQTPAMNHASGEPHGNSTCFQWNWGCLHFHFQTRKFRIYIQNFYCMHFPPSFLVDFFFLCIFLIEKNSQKPPFIDELQSKKHLQSNHFM